MLNNKGQSLVLFVILMPIFLIILVGIVNIGQLAQKKAELKNINKIVLNYGLDHIDNPNIVNEMKDLAKENNKNIDIEISFVDMEFKVTINYYSEGIYSKIINTKRYKIESIYKGYLDNKKKKIIKIK